MQYPATDPAASIHHSEQIALYHADASKHPVNQAATYRSNGINTIPVSYHSEIIVIPLLPHQFQLPQRRVTPKYRVVPKRLSWACADMLRYHCRTGMSLRGQQRRQLQHIGAVARMQTACQSSTANNRANTQVPHWEQHSGASFTKQLPVI